MAGVGAVRGLTWAAVRQRISLPLIYILTSLYALCGATQFPMLPYLWTQLGGSTFGYGLLVSEFGALQLFGHLFSGPYVDKFGAKLFMGISMTAAASLYAITALATRPWMLIISKLPACLELCGLSARTLIAQQSVEEDRARLLGYVGVAVGVAAAVGPSFGGLLTTVSFQFCSWIAAAIAFSLTFFVPIILPAQRQDYKAVEHDMEMPEIKHPTATVEKPVTVPSANSMGSQRSQNLIRPSNMQRADSLHSRKAHMTKEKLHEANAVAQKPKGHVTFQGSPLARQKSDMPLQGADSTGSHDSHKSDAHKHTRFHEQHHSAMHGQKAAFSDDETSAEHIQNMASSANLQSPFSMPGLPPFDLEDPGTPASQAKPTPSRQHSMHAAESQGGTPSRRRQMRSGSASRTASAMLHWQTAPSGDMGKPYTLQLEEAVQQLEADTHGEKKKPVSLRTIFAVAKEEGVMSILIIKALIAASFIALSATSGLLLKQQFDLEPQGTGMMISYEGVLLIIVQGFVVGPVANVLSVRQVVIGCGWGVAVGFAALGLAVKLWMYITVLPFLLTFIMLIETICTAQATKLVPPERVGTVLALDQVQLGAAVMIAPCYGAAMLQWLGLLGVGISGACSALIMLLLVHSKVLHC